MSNYRLLLILLLNPAQALFPFLPPALPCLPLKNCLLAADRRDNFPAPAAVSEKKREKVTGLETDLAPDLTKDSRLETAMATVPAYWKGKVRE